MMSRSVEVTIGWKLFSAAPTFGMVNGTAPP
jgi:hypothetical protein